MARLGYRELGLAFLKIGLTGFGGVGASAYRVIVEERGWLSGREYAGLLGLGQILPGANTVNVAVMLGDRARGWKGATLALACLMAGPVVILTALLVLYERAASLEGFAQIQTWVSSAAAGLIWGVAFKMLRDLERGGFSLVLVLATFVPIGLLDVSMGVVLPIAGVGGLLWALWAAPSGKP